MRDRGVLVHLSPCTIAIVIRENVMTTEATSYLGQAVTCLNNGSYDLAIKKCSAAIWLHRAHTAGFYLRAIAFRAKGQHAHANAHAAAFYLRAIAYRAKGQYAHARADFEQAMRLAPPGSIAGMKDAIKWDRGDATGF